MKKLPWSDIVNVGGFLITIAGIVFAAGSLRSDVNHLKETENSNHAETVQTLKEHDSKIDKLTTSVARIQGAFEHTVRTKGGGGSTNDDNGQ